MLRTIPTNTLPNGAGITVLSKTKLLIRALKVHGIETAEFEKFLVVNIQSGLFGIERRDVITVSFNSVSWICSGC